VAFLVLESTLLLFDVGSYLVNDAVAAMHLSSKNAGINQTIVDVAVVTNVVSLVGLVVVAGVGIADAFLRFRGEEIRWRRVPRDDVPGRYRLGLGPQGLAFRF